MTQKIEATNILKSMFSPEGMTFDNEESWGTLAEHVEYHNQYLSKELKYNVSWDDALFSWYENIYTPIKRAISQRRVRRAFPMQTVGDLYLDVSDHWFYLKEKHANVFADQAALHYTQKNKVKSANILTRIFKGSEARKNANNNGKRAA